MTTGKLLKIGDVARRLGVAVSTIRKYEASGIVLPIRTVGKHRMFSEDDAYWLAAVRDMITHKGMTLEAIKRMIAIVPCWAMQGCSPEERVKCPAYTDDSAPCWTLECVKRGRTTADCRTCYFYKSVTHCKSIKALVSEYLGPSGN